MRLPSTPLAVAALLVCFLVGTSYAADRPEAPVTIGVQLTTTNVARAASIFNFNAASPQGFWTYPVAAPANISSAYGPRWKFSTTQDDFHRGIDYYGDIGAPISSIAAGSVYQVHTEAGGTMPGGGNVVVIDHPVPAALSGIHPFHDRNVTKVFAYYLHLDAIDSAMEVGATVTVGQRVGTMGQSGTTTFTHLHFETRLEGYCSYQYQWERNRVASPTSFCNTGFDPHVHPYLFTGDGSPSAGTRRLFATTGFGVPDVVASVRYCADRARLDADVIETNLGTVHFGTRAGVRNISTLDELDRLANITTWLNLRPQKLGSTGTEHCYDMGFRGAVPTYLEVRGIDGTGVRTEDVTAAATTTTTTTTAPGQSSVPTSTNGGPTAAASTTSTPTMPATAAGGTPTAASTTTVPSTTAGGISSGQSVGQLFSSSAAQPFATSLAGCVLVIATTVFVATTGV